LGKQFDFQEKDALWQLLRQTTRIIAKIRDREVLSTGISADASAVLFTVARQGEQASPASVARELSLEPHSVSEQLKRMQKDGLIRKVRDSKKKNRVRIVLTESGHTAYTTAPGPNSIRKLMSGMTADERRMLWVLLARLRDEALEYLDMPAVGAYPPSNPKSLWRRISTARQVALGD
jgi:DNA-binding MarR family transcriptional regulator